MKILWLLLLTTSVASICTQLALLREFINIFTGNELIIAVFLSIWILFTGLGAYLGRFTEKKKEIKKYFLGFLLLLLAVLPVISLNLLHLLYSASGSAGRTLGLAHALVFAAVALAPFGIVHGAFFTIFTAYYTQNRSLLNSGSAVARVFALDAGGDLLGGALFSFVFIYLLPNTASLIIPCAVLAGITLFFLIGIYKFYAVFIGGLFTIALLFLLLTAQYSLNQSRYNRLFSSQRVLKIKNTKYGRIAVTVVNSQTNVYENTMLLFHTDNTAAVEKKTHLAAGQLKKVTNILLIGGAFNGMAEEVKQYKPRKIICIAKNYYLTNILPPGLNRLPPSFSGTLSPGKHALIFTDDRRFVAQDTNYYNCIIADKPDPLTMSLNRYYTSEFFRLIKKRLSPGGVFGFTLDANQNYMAEAKLEAVSSVYKSLQQVFKNIIIFPLDKLYFVASDKKLYTNIPARLQEKQIKTKYVNRYYLQPFSLRYKIKRLTASIKHDAEPNRDYQPLAFFKNIKHWSIFFGGFQLWFIPLLSLLCLLAVLLQSRTSVILFSTGFTCTILEIITITLYQILIADLYHNISILITLFMAGIISGIYLSRRILQYTENNNRRLMLYSQSSTIIFCLFYWLLLQSSPHAAVVRSGFGAVFFLLVYSCALPLGIEINCLTSIYSQSAAQKSSRIFSADMLGAFTGLLLASTVFLPLLGFPNTLLLILTIKMLFLFYTFKAV